MIENQKTNTHLENAREAGERPITIQDLSMYIRYLIDRTRKDVSEAVDAKDKERKGRTEAKFIGIAQTIGTLLSNSTTGNRISGPKELINTLNQYEATATQDLNTAESRKDSGEIKRIENVLKQIEDTRYFAEHLSAGELRHGGFLEWQGAQIAKSSERNHVDPTVEDANKDQRIKEAKLMLDVMTEGSVGLYTSLPTKYAEGGHAGFGRLIDSRRDGTDRSAGARDARGFFGLGDRALNNKYGVAQVREFVALIPAKKDVYKEIVVSVKEKRLGGLFGSKTVTEKKQVKTGERPVLHSESVANGKNEPLYRLWYCVQNNTEDNTGNYSLSYRDHSDRPGNMLNVEVLLPESVALNIMQEVRSNPAFIRKIAEQAIINKLGIPEKAWKDGDEDTIYPLRPPYERWDAQSGGKIYMKEAGDEYGFKLERIVLLKH